MYAGHFFSILYRFLNKTSWHFRYPWGGGKGFSVAHLCALESPNSWVSTQIFSCSQSAMDLRICISRSTPGPSESSGLGYPFVVYCSILLYQLFNFSSLVYFKNIVSLLYGILVWMTELNTISDKLYMCLSFKYIINLLSAI